MAYVKKTIISGSVIEIEKYHTTKFRPKNFGRRKKAIPTTEIMQKINERNAIKKICRLINANFGENDYHIILTYAIDQRATNPGEAKKDLQNFLRNLRAKYRRRLLELKYIAVTEYGKGSMHHHLIISAGIDINDLTSTWKKGRMHINPMDDSGEYSKLAGYLVKQTKKTFNDPERKVFAKRWCQSSNLQRPIEKTEIVRADSWREKPVAPKGYYVVTDSIRADVSEETKYPYQYYVCLPIKTKGRVKKNGKHRHTNRADYQ